LYDVNPDAAALDFLKPYKQKVDSLMGPVVGKVAHDMEAKRPESDLSNLLPDIFMHMAQYYHETPDSAIYNMGGIRADLTKGEVTYGDVLDVAPFENKICFVTLNGEQMITLFQQMAKRGGEGVSRGVELVIEGPENDTKMKSVRLHGKEIDPKAEYRIATINYLLEGNDGMPILKEGTNKIAPDDASNNTRFLIMNYFLDKKAKGEIVDSKVEGRIVRVK
jgi:2',3'-cyclic-nucleotide 2'-phosphodiesterase (5'-nucleotidase family)